MESPCAGELRPAGEETERELYLAAIDALTAAGFEHYEVSNFAQPGFRCRHNEAYWLGASYYAAGPGAARYVAGVRSMNHRSTTTWIERLRAGASPVAEHETLTPIDRARELLVFALRRLEGVDQAWFQSASGTPLDELIGSRGRGLIENGLLERASGRLRLTRAGLLVADGVCGELLRGD
ncbi:MAG: hypothetical protein QM811_00500 [Pirellulales bacterium]